MSSAWGIIAETRIEQALQQGEFENLPGKGQPLDLNEYFNTPVTDRLAFSILKNATMIPSEVELLREIELLQAKAKTLREEAQQAQSRKLIQTQRLTLAMAMERR